MDNYSICFQSLIYSYAWHYKLRIRIYSEKGYKEHLEYWELACHSNKTNK